MNKFWGRTAEDWNESSKWNNSPQGKLEKWIEKGESWQDLQEISKEIRVFRNIKSILETLRPEDKKFSSKIFANNYQRWVNTPDDEKTASKWRSLFALQLLG